MLVKLLKSMVVNKQSCAVGDEVEVENSTGDMFIKNGRAIKVIKLPEPPKKKVVRRTRKKKVED